MSLRPDEARVQAIGRELFDRVAGERQAFYSADRWTAALFAWSLANESAKLQLFRFIDVLPALQEDRDLVRHLREYFEGRDAPYAALLRTALGVARVGWLGEKVVAVMLRETVRRLARRFVAGSTPAEARRAALTARGRPPSRSTSSARRVSPTPKPTRTSDATRLLETLGARRALGRGAAHRPRRVGTAARREPSVKISALHRGSTGGSGGSAAA